MFFQDFPYILSWWSIIFLIGTIFFPFTNRLFTNFKDRGYIFAKIIGIAVLSYLAWLLGFLHLLPFGQPSLYLILFGLVFLNLIWWQKNPAAAKIDLSARLKNNWTFIKIIIFEEVIFSATFVFWAFVKGHQSDIQGLEKFMDFGFINSILHSIYFPPPDMWLVKAASATSDNFINYYYFGHLVTAVLTKLSNLDPAVTFNLMLSTIFAFTFTGSFSIAINLIASSLSLRGRVLWSSDEAILTRHSGLSRIRFWSPRLLAGPQNDDRNQIASLPRSVHTNVVARNDNIITIIFSLLTAFLVTLAGNLHTIYAFTKGYLPADKPIPFWQLLGKGIDFSAYWYPNATRFIPFAIHEFPSYSFVVSDLHGHVLDIPFVLLTIALLLSLVLSTSKIKSTKTFDFLPELLPFDLLLLTLLGFLLAIMYMTNAWDGLIYFGLSALVFLYIYYQHYWPNLNSLILKFFNSLILLVVLFVLFSLPLLLCGGIYLSFTASSFWGPRACRGGLQNRFWARFASLACQNDKLTFLFRCLRLTYDHSFYRPSYLS
ncbi:hypothetical protein HY030_02005 [Candidatus Gottesmanbacteria bacterium]|nr:hypothetical protein [Candidatus Gottesmanbacteria bacterium]